MTTPDLNFDTLPDSLRLPAQSAWQRCLERDRGLRENLPPPVASTLPLVFGASCFVAEQCARRPELLAELIDGGRLLRSYSADEYASTLSAQLEQCTGESELMVLLRRFRNREMVRIAWRDIAGWAPLNETLTDLSLLAESCVQAALDRLFQDACAVRGTPLNRDGQPQSLVVLGMGKLGAYELNFSSDIDLIFAYRDDGVLPDKRETAYSEFYTRLARNLVKVLDGITEDGFVFRIDTRLRPFGDSGPLVMNFDAMEAYYQSQAREWERYAMVKARPIAGDMDAGKELMEFLRPFVYRRYLDYRALGELRDLKQKISQELQRKDRQENVKLGPGGIREIEFIGQAFQLIRGGREKRLRERRIRKVLATLAELGLLPEPVVERLDSAYGFLRLVENRLQQYADEQTHDLPKGDPQRAAVAHALGFAGWSAFKARLDEVRAGVHEIFDQVITGSNGEAVANFAFAGDEDQKRRSLESLGWPDPVAGAALLDTFMASHAIRHLTARGETELKRLMPMLLRAAAPVEQPGTTLERLLALLEAVASRNVYLTLLVENPPALAHLVKLAEASPWIVHYIARHPLLLDELLDPRTLYTPLSRDELRRELERRLESVDTEDQEQWMIALRQFKQATLLRVAAADLSGAIPIMVVSDYLTYIAEVLVEAVVQHAWRITAARHGVPTGHSVESVGGFAVVSYGKMGGLELGYGSDLDLVFLYDGNDAAPTTGDKPVSTSEFYGRMGKRIIHLLTTNTPAGILYEVDLRLRPSGSSGLLVSSLEAYETYQMNTAWTWEQQALVKARSSVGDPAVAERFSAIRHQSLSRSRDAEHLRTEVREMREKMRASLSDGDPAWFQLKHDPGGIVDIEFLVQFGVLAGAHEHPRLTQWPDVVRQLDSLTDTGFLAADDASLLRQAYCLYRERGHRAALQEQPPRVPATEYLDLRSRVSQIWHDTMER